MKAQIINALMVTINQHPEIIPYLTGRAAKLAQIDADVMHNVKKLERDPREPGIERKQKFERKIKALMIRVFDRQAQVTHVQLSTRFPAKAVPDIDVSWTDDETEELVSLYMEMMADGIDLFDDETKIDGVDYTFANIEAHKFVKDYTFELIRGIDKTTREALRQALTTFIDVPGTTIGDIMAVLPYSAERALRVAVTEVTRAYGEAAKIAGDELQKQFPDIKFYKTWFTNVDEHVCDLCQELDNTTIPLDQPFADDVQNPPRHVGCRCWINTISEMGLVE